MLSDFILKDPFTHPVTPPSKKGESASTYKPFAELQKQQPQQTNNNETSKEETVTKDTNPSSNNNNNMVLTYFPCPHENRVVYESREFCKDCGARKYNAGFAFKSEDMKQLVVTSPNRIYRKVFKEKKLIIDLSGHTEYLQQRSGIINFMIDLGEKMGICKPAVYLGVLFLDIFVSQDDGSTEFSPLKIEEHLSMYGGIAVFLGAKGIELDDRVPLITALHYYLKMPMYTKEDLLQAEKKALSILKFEMHRPTLYDLVYFYAGQGVIFPDDKQKVLQKTDSPTRISKLPSTPQQNLSGKQVVQAIMVKYDITPFKFVDIVTKMEKDLVKLAFLAIKENDFYSYDLEVLGAACVCFLREKLSLWDGYRDDFLEISGQSKIVVQQCRSKFLTRFEQYFRPNMSFVQPSAQKDISATPSSSTTNILNNGSTTTTAQPSLIETKPSQAQSVLFSVNPPPKDNSLHLSPPDFSNWRGKESVDTIGQIQTAKNATSFSYLQYSKLTSGNLSTRNTSSEIPKVETKLPEIINNGVSFSTLTDLVTTNSAKSYTTMTETNNNSNNPSYATNNLSTYSPDLNSLTIKTQQNPIPSYTNTLNNYQSAYPNNYSTYNTNIASSTPNNSYSAINQPTSGLSTLANNFLRDLSSSPQSLNGSPQQQSNLGSTTNPSQFSLTLTQIHNSKVNTPSSMNSPMLDPANLSIDQNSYQNKYKNNFNNINFNQIYSPLNGTPSSISSTPLETFSQVLNKNTIGTQDSSKFTSVLTPINHGISSNPVNGGNFCNTVNSMGYGSTSLHPSSFARKNLC